MPARNLERPAHSSFGRSCIRHFLLIGASRGRKGLLSGLKTKRRGRKSASKKQKRIRELESENEKLNRQLKKARTVIDVQKNSQMLWGNHSGKRHDRGKLMEAALELKEEVGVAAAYNAVGLPRSSYYRLRKPKIVKKRSFRKRSPRALREQEREAVREVLHCERYMGKAPSQVYASLLV